MVRRSKRLMVLALTAVLVGNEALAVNAASQVQTAEETQETQVDEQVVSSQTDGEEEAQQTMVEETSQVISETKQEVKETKQQESTAEKTTAEKTTEEISEMETKEAETSEAETSETETSEVETTEEEATRKKIKEKKLRNTQANENELTYTFDELKQTLNWGTEITVNEDGSALLQFPTKYNQFSLKIPEDVDISRLETIVCNTDGDTSHLSVKTYADEGMQKETSVVYGNPKLSVDKLTADDMACVGIMSLANEYEITINSITFILSEEKKDEEHDKVTLNAFAKGVSENNPIVTQRYSADPGVMVYDDTVYVYTTNDIYEYKNGEIVENTYADITTLNCFSSTDMVNWTDHGTIQAAGSDGAATWAKNSWAPCAAHKKINGKDKFFLYFADNGGGIGVLTADSPTGPWSDPLGKGLITRSTPNCSTVEWLFDPAVLVDDDGTGYLYFGGGVPKGQDANPKTARVVKLGDDMISLDGTPVTIEPPYLFEDSGINKIDGKYYYSYCSNWNTSGSAYSTAAIEYMVSDNPMGPFTYAGEMFKNPGVFFNVWGNNHHSLFEFQGKYYLAYHARALETGVLGKNLGYRSTQIDEVQIENGKIQNVTATMTGVSQLSNVNPYKQVEAECIGRELGIEVTGSGNTVVKAQNGDWTCVKGVDFAKGVSQMILSVKADSATTIEIRTGSPTGTLLGTAQIKNTQGAFQDFTANVTNVTGVKSVYFVFKGDVIFDHWKAQQGNTVTFDQLEEVTSYDLTKEITEDGALKITYNKKYAEIRFAIPEQISTAKLDKMVLHLTSGDKKTLSLKLLKEYNPAEELAVGYEVSELSTQTVANRSDIKYFGIMALAEGVSYEIASVEFVMQSDDETELSIQTDVPDLKAAIAQKTDTEFLTGVSITNNELTDKNLMALVTKHFNAVTLGNELKPDCLFGYSSTCPKKHTETLNGTELEVPTMDYSRAEKMLDYILEWNKKNPQDTIRVRGHVLVWHSQTPEWFFHENYDADQPYVDAETMTLRQEWFIKTVLEHFTGKDSKYKDLFYGWDVVNEAVSDSRGTYRNGNENSSWWKVYGSNEYIINAFRFANQYAPANIELYYNDYNEWVSSKVTGIVQLLKDVKNAKGTRIDGFGMQGHYQTDGSPSIEDFKKAARAYATVVDKIQLTELDMKASSTFDGTDATLNAEYTKLAYRYKQVYEAVLALRAEGVDMSGMTIWGVIDKNSWLQTSNSVGGSSDGSKKQCPLLFDDNYQVKPSYWSFVDDTKLEPEIKTLNIIESADEEYTTAEKIILTNGDTQAEIFPEWSDEGLRILANVKNDKADASDAITVYVSVNGTIYQQTVLCKDAKKTAQGYEAQLMIPLEKETLQVASELLVDFVMVNGGEKTAYNDYTMNQDKSDRFYAKAVLKPYTKISGGTVTIDGERDAQWDKAVEIPLTIRLGAQTNATARLLWDKDYLYVYAQIEDSVLNSDSANAHEKDSFEIFIDENNHKSDSYEEDDKQYRINYLNEHSFNGTKCKEENVTSKVVLTKTGYCVEAAFAWTDITPTAGTKIGLELQINDADATGKRIGTLSWYDTSGSGWSKPGVFGTALLQGSDSTEPTEPDLPDDKPQPTTPSDQQTSNGNNASQTTTNSNTQAAVVTTRLQSIAETNVPLAAEIVEENDTSVNIMCMDGKAVLRQALLYKYRGQKLMIMAHLGNGIGYSIDASQIGENVQDIDLSATMQVIERFAAGFDSFRVEPRKSTVLGQQMGIHLNVGAQYAGKMAFIFQKNLTSGKYELYTAMLVNEIGNVAVTTNVLSNLYILIQQ